MSRSMSPCGSHGQRRPKVPSLIPQEEEQQQHAKVPSLIPLHNGLVLNGNQGRRGGIVLPRVGASRNFGREHRLVTGVFVL